MEDGGVKLLKERLEKFFHRVSVLNFIYNLSSLQTDFLKYTQKFVSYLQKKLGLESDKETEIHCGDTRTGRKFFPFFYLSVTFCVGSKHPAIFVHPYIILETPFSFILTLPVSVCVGLLKSELSAC